MKLRLKVNKIKNVLIYFFLFLAAMNFQAKFFYFVFIVFFLIVLQRRIKINAMSAVYLALCLLMAAFNYKEGLMSILRCFSPVFCYIVGLNIVMNTDSRTLHKYGIYTAEMNCYLVLVMISFGSFTHFMLNYFYNFGKFLGRNTNDIWTGGVMAATGQCALVCMMIGLSVSMLFAPIKKWHRLVACASIVFMILYILILATRTPIVIFLVMLLIGLFYSIKNSQGFSKKIRYILVFSIFLVIVLLVYMMNIGGIQDFVKSSAIYERFAGSLSSFSESSGRNNAKALFIMDGLNYPFGGINMRKKYGYAHDLLLDGYDEYGFFALVFLIAILIAGIVQLYKVLRSDTISGELKLSLLLINVAVLMEFTVEPILEGMSWLFSCYCLINGCMTSLNWNFYQQRKRSKITQI